MDPSQIIQISFSALVTVFSILAGLAIIMKIITKLFPVKDSQEDSTVYAAIASVHASIYPGTKITKMKEVK